VRVRWDFRLSDLKPQRLLWGPLNNILLRGRSRAQAASAATYEEEPNPNPNPATSTPLVSGSKMRGKPLKKIQCIASQAVLSTLACHRLVRNDVQVLMR